MKNTPFYTIFILLCVVCFLATQSCSSNSGTTSAKFKIALREAGNQLLLKQKDSSSLILPVIEKHQNHYVVAFEKQLSFEPDQLVTSMDSTFIRAGLPSAYRVEVLRCSDQEVAYSYEMNLDEERTLIPCSGRLLPKACYTIEVKFLNTQDKPFQSSTFMMVILAVIFLLSLIVYFNRRGEKQSNVETGDSTFSKIGSFEFYPEQNKLVKSAVEISLSKKECELLEIFVTYPNQVVKRDELTKKVWEDNGVIVGRSLDTYISKLRKKLQDDERIKITNVHGVGYKLEIL